MKTGSSASAAVLRKTSSTGVRSSRTGRYQAIAAPTGTAVTTARPKPAPARTRLAWAWRHSSPSVTISDQRVQDDVQRRDEVGVDQAERGARPPR